MTMNRVCTGTVKHVAETHSLRALVSNIQLLCNSGRLQDALKLLLLNPILLYQSVCLKILQLCIDQLAENEGRLIHNHLFSNGFHSNLHVNNKLMIFYSKMGEVHNTRDLFDKMGDRKNIISWTAMISAYSQNGYFIEALKVFSLMHRLGVNANQFTYGSALRACTKMVCLSRGKQIQGRIHKGRFFENLFVKSALLDMHSKCGEMKDACYLFDSMVERDLVAWNSIIGGYAVQKETIKSIQMFCLMLSEGRTPDSFTFGSLLRAFSKDNDLVRIRQTHGITIRLGFEYDNIVNGSLIDAYAKNGSIRSAKQIYRNMPNKDIISCTALINACAREGKFIRDALNLFYEINQMQLGVDDVILCSMLNVCSNIASLGIGRQIHALAFKCRSNYDVATGNALIDMYAKSGSIDEANRVFDEMDEKNIISWTSLISAHGKHGYGNKAMSLYKIMVFKGLKPNDVTFLSLLFACSHNGLTNEGMECFDSMVNKYKIMPRLEHYSCLIDLLARGGQLEEAYDLLCKKNFKPSPSLWGSILGACGIYGNISLGEVAAKELFYLDPCNSINYVVLASIYASACFWNESFRIRKLMEKRCLVKDRGYSYYQSTNRI